MRLLTFVALLAISLPALAAGLDPILVEKAKSPDNFTRVRAALALARIGSAESTRLLLTLLDDPDPYVRDGATIACRAIRPDVAVKTLAGGARTKKELLRLNVAEALGRTQSPAGLAHLARLVGKDRAARVRAQGLNWMWKWGEIEGALAVAVDAYDDKEPVVRAAAVEAAGRMRGDPALELARRALTDEDEGVRCVARLEMRYLNPAEANKALPAAAKDPGWRTRAQAVEDAIHLRERESVDALVELVGDEVLRVSAAAHRALLALSGKEIGRDIDLWRSWWKANRDAWKAPKGKLAPKAMTADKSVARFQGMEVTSGRVCFVLDGSGSMADPMPGDADGRTRWQYVAAELVKTLDALPDGTLVNVISFDLAPTLAFKSPKPLNRQVRGALERFVTKQSPENRGDLLAAVNAALDQESIDTIILLSDGAPSYGEIVDKGRVRSFIRQRNRMLKRSIMTIGFGAKEKRARAFMEGLAADSGGVCVLR